MHTFHTDHGAAHCRQFARIAWGPPGNRCRRVRKGRRIFKNGTPNRHAYLLVKGEIVVLRNGLPVDLVEAGETLDPRIYGKATAIARTDCTLIRG